MDSHPELVSGSHDTGVISLLPSEIPK